MKPQVMPKAGLLAMALVAGLALCAPTSAESDTFFGGGFASDTENCSWWQAELIHQFRARYTTDDQESGAPASLAFFFDVFSISYEIPGGLVPGRQVETGMYGATFAHTFHFLPEEARPIVRISAPPAATTLSGGDEIHVLLSFENWVAEAGCTAEVEVWLRRLELPEE